MAIQEGDFVELDYTGTVVENGAVFDTTDKKIAASIGMHNHPSGTVVICVGKQQVMPALDQALVGKNEDTTFALTISPEQGFGKKDAHNIRMFPLNAFKKHDIRPVPGLRVEIDDNYGTVKSVAGGRIIVDFNHPLASKELSYRVKIGKKITELSKQATWLIALTLNIPQEKVHVTVAGNKANIQIDGLKKDEEVQALTNVFKITLPKAIPAITDVAFTKQ